jgi:hypothetical protein
MTKHPNAIAKYGVHPPKPRMSALGRVQLPPALETAEYIGE